MPDLIPVLLRASHLGLPILKITLQGILLQASWSQAMGGS